MYLGEAFSTGIGFPLVYYSNLRGYHLNLNTQYPAINAPIVLAIISKFVSIRLCWLFCPNNISRENSRISNRQPKAIPKIVIKKKTKSLGSNFKWNTDLKIK